LIEQPKRELMNFGGFRKRLAKKTKKSQPVPDERAGLKSSRYTLKRNETFWVGGCGGTVQDGNIAVVHGKHEGTKGNQREGKEHVAINKNRQD
jgi:hypothetical protein